MRVSKFFSTWIILEKPVSQLKLAKWRAQRAVCFPSARHGPQDPWNLIIFPHFLLLGNNDHCLLGPLEFGVMICPSFKNHLVPQDLKSRDWYLKIEKLQFIFTWYIAVLLEMNFALKINDEFCDVWGIFQKWSGGLSLPCKPVDSPHKLIRARQLWSLTLPAGTKDKCSEFWDRLELFCYILFLVSLL